MGCICSKESTPNEPVPEIAKERQNEQINSSVLMVAPSRREEVVVGVVQTKNEGSVNAKSKVAVEGNGSVRGGRGEESGKVRIIERPKDGHQRRSTMDFGTNGAQQAISRIASMAHGTKGEQAAAGWPSWLSAVAGEAIQGWVPRSAESFEKLNKIGQGTYSSVYRARDLQTNKIVAIKKVRFANMDPESVRFMAREICILRRLDHPNVMKLEALVTSRISGSLYLVFQYMEHDLAGLAASPEVTFTEAQIKCYMQQMLQGLLHCHSRGVLHRDIKGSNLLVGNDGVLKIGDFGLATFFQTNQKEPLTSRVVTLWYRAPELLLGATEYGVAIDMWSAGCILAELFSGKPIMQGRTEVEQIHKIFKLCGSPSEEYWNMSKLPQATSFKPQHPYKRRVDDTFKDFPHSALALLNVLLSIEPEKRSTAASALKNQFFTTRPLPCDPSSLPKYTPSKELDAKLRDEEARRRNAESVKGHGADSLRKNSRKSKGAHTPELNPQAQGTRQGQPKCTSVKFNPQEDSGAGFPIEPPRGNKNKYAYSNSMIHPNAAWNSKAKEDASQTIPGRTYSSSQHGKQISRQASPSSHPAVRSTNNNTAIKIESSEETMGYVPKRNRILCSGPLMMPLGGNMDDMLKEHERQIQEVVRKARLEKNRSRI